MASSRLPATAGVLRSLVAGSREEAMRISIESNLSPTYIAGKGLDAVLEDLLRHPPRARPLSGLVGQIHAALRHDARRRLDALREKPVLVVSGAHDKMVRPQSSQALAEALDAEWLLMEDAGHAFLYEQPERVNGLLRVHFGRG